MASESDIPSVLRRAAARWLLGARARLRDLGALIQTAGAWMHPDAPSPVVVRSTPVRRYERRRGF